MAEINDDEMFSMSYKDARDKYAVGVGSNKYFMSESDFNKGKERINKKNAEKQAASNKEEKPKEEKPKKEQSLVANQFGARKEKTWNDVKSEYKTPEERANYLNTATDYTPGELTKKGMEADGYIQGADGKWVLKPKTETPTTGTTTETTTTDTSSSTTSDYASELEKLKKENEEFRKQLESLQNPKTGETDEEGAKSLSDEHMKRGLEIGALTLDKDGNYVLTNVNKKGWEDWATIASAGLSVLGLAMGVPIIPINFRKITNKDKKDEAIREFQKQLTDISAGNLAKVKDVESSKEAGDYIKKNQDSIDAFTKYKKDNAATKDILNAQTTAEKELIETRTEAQIKADKAQFENDMKRLEADNTFKLNYQYLQSKYDKEFAAFEDALATNSTKELLKYQNTEMLKEIQQMINEKQIDLKDMAKYRASLNGIRPDDVIYGRIMQGVDAGAKLITSVGSLLNPVQIGVKTGD